MDSCFLVKCQGRFGMFLLVATLPLLRHKAGNVLDVVFVLRVTIPQKSLYYQKKTHERVKKVYCMCKLGFLGSARLAVSSKLHQGRFTLL